jgi:UDP-N-acetylmuramate dehydrogenase
VREVAFLPLRHEMPAPAGEPEMIDLTSCAFRYRTSLFQERPGVILWVRLGAERADETVTRDRLRRFRDHRKATQPLSWPNCGSVFRNPPGQSAGRLVEAAGGKGHRIGNAAISDVHGNFIVNLGGARAADVLGLIEWAQAAVHRHSGVLLETEVRVLP